MVDGVMENYPKILAEFESQFTTEEVCRDYLFKLRWPKGFRCPRCGHAKAWSVGTVLYQCRHCNYQMSVIAGTIFQDTHKPLTLWFRAIWWLTGQTNGASALGMKKILGLGSYRTAWVWLHKLRRAMVSPGREKLFDEVEIGEIYIGRKRSGKRSRETAGKALVVIAAEDRGVGFGRIRLRHIPDASNKILNQFINDSIKKDSTIKTNAWCGYKDISSLGYRHVITNQQSIVGDNLLPHIHRVASLLKLWLLGIHQGAVSHEHLDYYLDEYTFRVNSRTLTDRGELFYRVLQNAVQIEPVSFGKIARHIRGRKSKKCNVALP
jgi:transposase-like protein